MDNHGQTLIKCKKCKENKPPEEYYKSRLTLSGLRGACKVCTRTQDREYRVNNVESVQYSTKRKRVSREYGITVEEYEARMGTSTVCEVCGKTESKNANDMFCYDHDHKTGKFRGVLCRACNQAIGLLGDNSDGLRKALLYLHKSEHPTWFEGVDITSNYTQQFMLPIDKENK